MYPQLASQVKTTTRTNSCVYTVYFLMMGYKYVAKTCRGLLTK